MGLIPSDKGAKKSQLRIHVEETNVHFFSLLLRPLNNNWSLVVAHVNDILYDGFNEDMFLFQLFGMFQSLFESIECLPACDFGMC